MRKMNLVLSIVLALAAESAFASTAINCGKNILTATGWDSELSAGGEEATPSGELSDPNLDFTVAVAGTVLKDGTIGSEGTRNKMTITVTSSFGETRKTVRIYRFIGVGEIVCGDSLNFPAVVSEAVDGGAAKVIAKYSCTCDID
jgi:hypothetical protein